MPNPKNADFKTVCETIIAVFVGNNNCQGRKMEATSWSGGRGQEGGAKREEGRKQEGREGGTEGRWQEGGGAVRGKEGDRKKEEVGKGGIECQ